MKCRGSAEMSIVQCGGSKKIASRGSNYQNLVMHQRSHITMKTQKSQLVICAIVDLRRNHFSVEG